jgi:hypothetical protein
MSRKSTLVLLFAWLCLPALMWNVAEHLQILSDRREMLSPTSSAAENWESFCRRYHYEKDFIILIHDPSAASASENCPDVVAATELLGQSLSADPTFEDVFYKIDSPDFQRQALFFLSKSQLLEIQRLLTSGRGFLQQLANPKGLDGLLLSLQASPSGGSSKQYLDLKDILPVWNHALRSLNLAIESRGGFQYQSPFGNIQPATDALYGRHVRPGDHLFYLRLVNARTQVVFAQPRFPRSEATGPKFVTQQAEVFSDIRALNKLNIHLNQVRRYYPNLQIFLTGEAALETAELSEAVRDCIWLGILTVIMLTVTMLRLIRCPRALLILLMSTVTGWMWLLGIDASLAPLNILTAQHLAFFGVVSIWWNAHILLRFALSRRSMGCARLARLALGSSCRNEILPFSACALALCLCLSWGNPSVQRLFGYTGLSLVVVSLQTTLLLPALIELCMPLGAQPTSRLGNLARQARTSFSLRLLTYFRVSRRVSRLETQVTAALILGLTLCGFLALPEQTLEMNLLDLPGRGQDFRQTENFLQPLGYSSLYGLVTAPSVDASREIADRLLKNPAVSRVDGLYQVWPSDLEAKRRLISKIQELSSELKPPAFQSKRSVRELLSLRTIFFETSEQLETRCKLELKSEPSENIKEQLRILVRELSSIRNHLDLGNPGPVEAGLSSYQRQLVADLTSSIEFLHIQSDVPPVLTSLIPDELRSRTLGSDGTAVLRVFPTGDSWNQRDLKAFCAALTSVDSKATGTPFLLLDYLSEVRRSLRVGVTAFGALCVVFWIAVPSWRRISSMVLRSLAFAGVGLGLAALMGITLNALNVWLWLLSIQVNWLFQLARESSDRRNWAEPLILASGILAVGASTMIVATHHGVRSCAAVFTLSLICQILLETGLGVWKRR